MAGGNGIPMNALVEDLQAAAHDEIERACTLAWRELARHLPWGDTFEGFTPGGREVAFERNYLWDAEPGGDIRVEVMVYRPRAYEEGVRLVRSIARAPPT
jgi:hypothetical protein